MTQLANLAPPCGGARPRRRPAMCAGCAANPRSAPGRSCAPNRCYCAHPECPAYDSYREPRRGLATVTPLPPPKARR